MSSLFCVPKMNHFRDFMTSMDRLSCSDHSLIARPEGRRVPRQRLHTSEDVQSGANVTDMTECKFRL